MRLSLAGAGTDIPAYWRRYGGAAVTATIDRYAYAMVSATRHPVVQLTSSDGDPDQEYAPAREILKRFNIQGGVSIFLTAELPANGGMTSVGARSVALIRALAELRERTMMPAQIAEMARQTVLGRMSWRCGVSDLYSVAVGGLNFVEVSESGVTMRPITLAPSLRAAVESRLMLFRTGRLQKSHAAIDDFRRAVERNRAAVTEALHEAKAAALSLRDALDASQIDAVGACLDRSWRACRRLAPGMSDPWVDHWYDSALQAGATGGEVNGLGNFGFLVLFCEPDRQARVTEVMTSMGLTPLQIHLEPTGVSLFHKESDVLTGPLARGAA